MVLVLVGLALLERKKAGLERKKADLDRKKAVGRQAAGSVAVFVGIRQ